MNLIFEESHKGHRCTEFPKIDLPVYQLKSKLRSAPAELPEVSECELIRHYTKASEYTFGVDSGFYPLGSCTMKYNPKVNEATASFAGFTDVHPLQPESTVQGCLEVMYELKENLKEITGMDEFGLQPSAGAHGEFTGMCLIKTYHESRNDLKRKKIIVPDSAHGTNPASAHMCGFDVISIPSVNGIVDLKELDAVLDDTTAGLMLTNPNTLGLYDSGILDITKKVHEAGGLCYYDGANLNAIMGISRPGDMGFDIVHLNLHKTFSTPHGGGGPGAGAVGCKEFLSSFLPAPIVEKYHDRYMLTVPEHSIGKVRTFHGNFSVLIRALTYLMILGREGVKETSMNAVLNANYLMSLLNDVYPSAYNAACMHEFVLSLEKMKQQTGVTALDIAKRMIDYEMHPPTMYFPMIVHEALMFEPTETESIDTLKHVSDVMHCIYEEARNSNPDLSQAPYTTEYSRPDEVSAARHTILKYEHH
ncbi:MAG: glycine dehydrogenase subunit 2 [Erysipelotrichia bacterium]|nr:glycine dehydrogenase subunit 2 [Erysipelotrichia bacterium]